ncbi:MAG: 50S ribosomal protein L29 [Sulfolobales archaeon]
MSISADEIRSMSKEDRMKLLQELRTELMKLRAQAAIGTLDKPHRIKQIRKTIARILTIEREEELRTKRGEKKRK